MVLVVFSSLNGCMKSKSSYDISGKALFFFSPIFVFSAKGWKCFDRKKESISLTTFGVLGAKHSF